MSRHLRSHLLLLLTAMIWGIAFVAQKSGGVIGAFTYNGIRTFLGGLVLIPIVVYLMKVQNLKVNRATIVGGIVCGIVLFVASSFQQHGINYTTAGKAGFITSLYAVLVPVLLFVGGKKIRPIIWFCVVLGTIGLYLLTMQGSFTLEIGDLLVTGCAICFAFHIIVIDYYSPQAIGVLMSCIQFLVAGGLGIICMFLFETPNLEGVMNNWIPIAYAGICSCGIAYTLQIVAQADADPTQASLILCLESVFSVIAGALILGERMSFINVIGCVLIFTAVVLSQLPEGENEETKL